MDYPLVSIIMPIRNEAAYIERSLRAILVQDYPLENMEIIIVDGMSDDGTREIIANYQQPTTNYKFFLLDNPSKIVPVALNIGLKQAKGEVIIRVDGHCEIAPDYVRRCVEVLQETGADCVGGTQHSVGEWFLSSTIALATTSPFGAGDAYFRYARAARWAESVYLGAYRKDVFERIGTFDEELVRNQDNEFEIRLRQAGGKIWLDPFIRCVYYSRQRLDGIWLQYFQYGVYRVRVIQKRHKILYRQLVPPIFVLAFILSLLTSLFKKQPIWFLSIIVPYIIVNITFSLGFSRKKLQTMPILAIVFFILHFAWGLGFIYGLWRWRKFWFSIKKAEG